MNTVFWLAVFAAVVGFGVSIVSWIGLYFIAKEGTPYQKFVIEQSTWVDLTPWRWLFAGIIGLIVAVTL